jgi:Tfp pilus assembly protein PilO
VTASAPPTASTDPQAAEHRRARWRTAGVVAAVCAAVTAAGYGLGISPTVEHLAEHRARLDELAARRDAGARLRADLAAVRRRLDQTTRAVADLPLRLEPAAALNGRLHRLAEAATAAGVTLDEMQPQPAVDGPHYQTVPVRVAGGGTYPACAAFLHALRADFPDTAVRAIEATNPSPARDGNAVVFRLDLAWHTMPAR